MVSEISELSISRVEQLARYRETAIRLMEPSAAAAIIGDYITKLAMQYGNREKIRLEVMQGIIELIGSEFKFLSPHEIKAAYKMWAADEIQADAMYGGQINAKQVGSVLSAYCEKRRADMAAYLIAVESIKAQQLAEERRQAMREAFENKFPQELKSYIDSGKDWREIPVFWYDVLEQRGDLMLSKEEKWSIWNDAEKLAIVEENERIHEKRTGGLTSQFKTIADRNEIQKSIAKRLSVFRYYIQNRRNE